ncbi:hypothetical protein [Cellulomonas dongxiuzhuiae]|uniref:Leucine-rich repeat domain-containing protein n=1 Tax=Cellulomonas dongxiuzhuiae TaxID=2819979 RepID=A0ABX8GJS4_9CELL|nr:hypothetical protein [Cellulomonas dongxiuzhuiae]MBO3089327.1 hypothetical protein [Cellulomonas dongxiuzhuiae]MBO3094887.1 hypothetical protein [Cellulomonas dongxiuzhuiae]QWC15916.1 hypothetical protein KKR89_16955 [Cellulomonas dongxiuzhuiae]
MDVRRARRAAHARRLRRFSFLQLEMKRGAREPFDFRCDDPPRTLRELRLMDAPLGSLAGIDQLVGLETLLLSPGSAPSPERPVDLLPLSRLPRLRDVRIVSEGPYESAEQVERSPTVEVSHVDDRRLDRRAT